MIDGFDLYNSFKSYVNTFQGGWYRPKTDFESAVNDISNQLWELWTKQAEKSQEIKDNLFPFLRSSKQKVEPQKGNYGFCKVPDDYGRFADARLVKGTGKYDENKTDEENAENDYSGMEEVGIELIDENKWSAVMKHATKKPTLNKPKMKQVSVGGAKHEDTVSYFMVAPKEVSSAVIDYYVRPGRFVFGYTKTPGNPQTGAGDQLIYDKNSSKPLEWPSTVINEFLVRLGERYGLFTRDQFVAQFSTQQKLTA